MDNSTPLSGLTYKEALDFLYSQLPMFSRTGAAAYKPGLERTIELTEIFGNPEKCLKAIHIAGTNGKGSSSHMLASVLSANGYKTALYTSPHLADFRERIRINGEMIPRQEVVRFVEEWQKSDSGCHPSFFELTMMMAFDWFARENVDYAVIETGMGGRLDSTNIITPLLSVITNISFDHTQFLGDTLDKIAFEKAGIIKPGIPVVVGEADNTTESVFRKRAKECGSVLREAYSEDLLSRFEDGDGWNRNCDSRVTGPFTFPLYGDYQRKNLNTVLHVCDILSDGIIKLDRDRIAEGIESVVTSTGFRGRWTLLQTRPVVICDTGHNEAGLKYNMRQLSDLAEKRAALSGVFPELHIVLGFVADKDVCHIIDLFPRSATYYITNANIPRAMKADELQMLCAAAGIQGKTYSCVCDAYDAAISAASDNDIIYVGGSTFIVADLLAALDR